MSTIATELKFCVNCKYHTYSKFLVGSWCDNPHTMHKVPIDLVDGSGGHMARRSCIQERGLSNGNCGVSGKLFEQKEIIPDASPKKQNWFSEFIENIFFT